MKLHRHEYKCKIEKACATLGISRGGYYEYLKRKPSKRKIENDFLSNKIKELFLQHDGRYGALSISLALQDEGIKVNHKRCGRIMRDLCIFYRNLAPLNNPLI